MEGVFQLVSVATNMKIKLLFEKNVSDILVNAITASSDLLLVYHTKVICTGVQHERTLWGELNFPLSAVT